MAITDFSKQAGLFGALIVLALSTYSCSLPPNMPLTSKTSRWHATAVPDGSLRVAEVVHVGTRDELVAGGWGYDVLIKAGIRDEQIRDGSAIATRVQCCGGPNEEGTAVLAFVPDDLHVSVGDIVEIWSGEMVTEDDPLGPLPNTVTRILGKGTNGDCRWTPNNPKLWGRVLYCDWMTPEGWSQQRGIAPYWIRPIGSTTPPKY